jgi:hypothetical protein
MQKESRREGALNSPDATFAEGKRKEATAQAVSG